ncbi:DUF190 domain-containing protein [Chromobacterium violaceum]|uniref:Uncharacterized ACR, COG1993 n=2 Tax=Chromobacterium violaceum TaxID=536 RepID=A0A1R0MDH4_CHRVL|nr:DUF190 domain-containing protein [Chromobacterium violaceum]AAQ58942.1 Conserved hypothetical protein [Chromobacterium violaceum ATCC 12472]ATP27947.1 hypothetical protein CRN81_05780 [Chromobacterium violaceum]ATP31858.1 hypothetical protein CR207_05795 [Chromobacterium violaceum]KJH67510.1 hypothetical protein UF16_09690 [Chromobacterium violaceum]KMN48475.1 hypothetical protein VK93_16130 [Chromobacterium violaceum]
MQGYQLSFFTQQGHRHHGVPLAEWILQEAHRLGIGGATLFAASEGFGGDRRIHAARFFELADQPEEVTMALSAQEAELLLDRLRGEGVKVFYVKTPVEYGMLGEK